MLPDPDPPLLSILSDQPADEDQLGFEPYAQTLAEIVADPGTDTPLTIGVFGGWGRGKTSLMRMVQRRLEEDADARLSGAHRLVQRLALQPRAGPVAGPHLARARRRPRFRHAGRGGAGQADANWRRASTARPAAAGRATWRCPPGRWPGLEGAALPPLMGLELLRRQAQRAGDEEAAAAAGDALPPTWKRARPSPAATRSRPWTTFAASSRP